MSSHADWHLRKWSISPANLPLGETPSNLLNPRLDARHWNNLDPKRQAAERELFETRLAAGQANGQVLDGSGLARPYGLDDGGLSPRQHGHPSPGLQWKKPPSSLSNPAVPTVAAGARSALFNFTRLGSEAATAHNQRGPPDSTVLPPEPPKDEAPLGPALLHSAFEAIAQQKVICSGVVAGTPEGFAALADEMVTKGLRCAGGGSDLLIDQAALNLFVYGSDATTPAMELIQGSPARTRTSKNASASASYWLLSHAQTPRTGGGGSMSIALEPRGASFVNTVGVLTHTPNRSLAFAKQHMTSDGIVLNDDGTPSPIVHQHDRLLQWHETASKPGQSRRSSAKQGPSDHSRPGVLHVRAIDSAIRIGRERAGVASDLVPLTLQTEAATATYFGRA